MPKRHGAAGGECRRGGSIRGQRVPKRHGAAGGECRRGGSIRGQRAPKRHGAAGGECRRGGSIRGQRAPKRHGAPPAGIHISTRQKTPGVGNKVTITVFAGISGIGKKDVVNEIIRHSNRKDEIHSIHFEDELLNRPPFDYPDMPSFLDVHNRRQKLEAITGAFRRITKGIEGQGGASHIFLTMHLSYFKNGEFFPPLMPHLFSPMLDKLAGARMNIVTLIDDAFTIRKRIHGRDEDMHPGTALRLREIMAWRSQEALCAEGLKIHMSNVTEVDKEPVRSYLVSVRHPHATFESLVFNGDSSRAYLSYPISSTRGSPDAVGEINGFREEVHRMGREAGTAVFDPVTIDELALRARA